MLSLQPASTFVDPSPSAQASLKQAIRLCESLRERGECTARQGDHLIFCLEHALAHLSDDESADSEEDRRQAAVWVRIALLSRFRRP